MSTPETNSYGFQPPYGLDERRVLQTRIFTYLWRVLGLELGISLIQSLRTLIVLCIV